MAVIIGSFASKGNYCTLGAVDGTRTGSSGRGTWERIIRLQQGRLRLSSVRACPSVLPSKILAR